MIAAKAIRVFRLSELIKEDFEALTLPLQIHQKPSPEVSALFWSTLSYLRFLDIHPYPDERWRCSLVLAGDLQDPQDRRCLPALRPPTRATLMNLSPERAVTVRIGQDTVPVDPLSGFMLEGADQELDWALEQEEVSQGLIALLVTVSIG